MALNILNYNPINLKQMPHFIHHILWFSGHSNCSRPNYEKKWLPFLGPHSMTSELQTLRIIRKLRRLYSLTQPVHIKVKQLFNFVILPAKNTLHPPCLAEIHIQTVRTIHARSRPAESYMNVNTRTIRERVK